MLALLLGLSGCASRRAMAPSPEDAAVIGRPDLARLGWRRVGLVAPLNRSGVPLAGTFLEAVARQVGLRGWTIRSGVLERPGTGHPPRVWWERQATVLGVQGFLTATVTALHSDRRARRAYAAATCGLVDATGNWVWSRRVTGLVVGDALSPGLEIGQNDKQPFPDREARDRLMAAVQQAAKEFALDFRIPH